MRGVVRVVAALCVHKALTFAHCGCSRSRRSAEEEQSLRLDDGAADGDDTDGTRNSTARSCSPTNERAARSALSVTRSAAAAARTKPVSRDRRASVRTNTHAPRDGRAPTDGHWAARVGLPAARAADSRRHVAEQSGPIDSLQRRRLAIMASGGGGRPAARAAARVSSALASIGLATHNNNNNNWRKEESSLYSGFFVHCFCSGHLAKQQRQQQPLAACARKTGRALAQCSSGTRKFAQFPFHFQSALLVNSSPGCCRRRQRALRMPGKPSADDRGERQWNG